MQSTPETLDALLLRFGVIDQLAAVPRISLSAALARGDDHPRHIIRYLEGLGMPVSCLDDLLQINADDTEEEIHCFRVVEGVAVSVASDGAWLLFEA
jgi:hypothetical protein